MRTILSFLGGLGFFLTTAAAAFADEGFQSGMMGGGMGRGMMYGGGFMNIFGVLLLVGVTILVYLAIVKLWQDVTKKK